MAKRIDVAKAIVKVAHPRAVHHQVNYQGEILHVIMKNKNDVAINHTPATTEEMAWVNAVFYEYEIDLEKVGIFCDAGWA